MKTNFGIVALLLIFCATAAAQVEPQARGRGGPLVPSDLHYALRYSQNAQFSSSLGNWQTSALSGSLDYANGSKRRPFSINYGGGYNWTISGPSYQSGLFQRLSLMQGFNWHRWSVQASDDVSYLPQAPTSGFSGIPGIGEPIGVPSPAPPPNQLILTLNTHTVNNNTNLELGHSLNYATNASLGGNWTILRYPDGNGLDTDTRMAHASIVRRLNSRNSLDVKYAFTQFSYPDSNFSFLTNSGTLGFQRAWTKRVTTYASAGPQWTSSSNGGSVPSSLGIKADASINYQFHFESAGLAYSHGVNGGSGYLIGAQSDTANANFSRVFQRTLTVGLNASYSHTVGLGTIGVINSRFLGAQTTKQLGPYVIVFANYSAMNQASSAALPSNTLNQLVQGLGFGIGYSPWRQTARR